MSAQFTPGPWTHHLNGSVRVCDGRHDTEVGCSAIAEAEILNVDRDVAVANAHLIAVAPELLEALKLLTGCCTASDGSISPEPHNRGSWLEAMTSARTAITKAEGTP